MKNKNEENHFDSKRIIKIIIMGMLLFGCGFSLYVISPGVNITIQKYLFMSRSEPIIQEAVIEQCDIPDYEFVGYIDESALDFTYNDHNRNIYCNLSTNPRRNWEGDWDCNCEERASE